MLRHGKSTLRFLAVVPLTIAALATFANGQSPTTTTITKLYTYNDDGALTSVTTQVDDGEPAVAYLTRDNFIPDAQDPATGQLTLGNGNLIAVGPAPGVSNATSRYSFDELDRVAEYSGGSAAVSYTYHPTSLMASATKTSGDTVHFYYDNSATPRMVTIERAATGEMSRQLGPLCSVTDGTRKVLMSPRKDVSGVYDPDADTFTPYSYDAYGEPSPFDPSHNETPGGDYDLANNPFRYAGEYRDPDWGGYYLRTRWYDPQLRVFLTRDPTQNLNRYGYTDGNPIARFDPTGQSHNAWNKFIRNPVDNVMERLDRHLADRLLVSPLLGPIALIADPVGFWHGLGPNDSLRLLSLVGIVGSGQLAGYAVSDANYLLSFAVAVGTNAGTGVASSYVAASSHGFHRLNRRLFYHGLEYTAGGILEYHFIFGNGYRPFNLELDDVIDKWKGARLSAPNGEGNEALVFRFKQNGSGSVVSGKGLSFLRGTNPVLDAFNTGWYHEGMLALGADNTVWLTEVTNGGLRVQHFEIVDAGDIREELERALRGAKTELQFVGRFTERKVGETFYSNPRNLVPLKDGIDVAEDSEQLVTGGTQQYALWGRNCQLHAGDILRALGNPLD
jgi:RHS repeat-associated protein